MGSGVGVCQQLKVSTRIEETLPNLYSARPHLKQLAVSAYLCLRVGRIPHWTLCCTMLIGQSRWPETESLVYIWQGFNSNQAPPPLWQWWWHPGRSTGRLCRLDHKPNTTKTSLATGSPDRPQRLQSEAADPWDILLKTSTVLHPHVGRGGEIWVCDPWRPANTAGPTCDVTFAY